MKDIRLENQSQVVQGILPSLTRTPPAMRGKTIGRSGDFGGLRGCWLLGPSLQDGAL